MSPSRMVSSPAPAATSVGPIRVGVSSCLLGQEVRFDGGHKKDDFLVDTLARFVELSPVCPEVEVGMGTPRPPVRLVRLRAREAPRLIARDGATDHTTAMREWAERRLDQLAAEDLSGYVLKKDSPSCGMERVRVYNPDGTPDRTGRGLFAAALIARFPLLPVEEEGRLRDPWLRENFIERVFAFRRLRERFADRWRAGDVVAFHTASKLLLLAHHRPSYDALGRLVAKVSETPRAAFAEHYQRLYMEALARVARPPQHANVLQHAAGYFKRQLDGEGRAELAGLIDDYRRGLVPLIAPITLLRHLVRVHQVDYLAGQLYFAPHPKELMLRNHA